MITYAHERANTHTQTLWSISFLMLCFLRIAHSLYWFLNLFALISYIRQWFMPIYFLLIVKKEDIWWDTCSGDHWACPNQEERLIHAWINLSPWLLLRNIRTIFGFYFRISRQSPFFYIEFKRILVHHFCTFMLRAKVKRSG